MSATERDDHDHDHDHDAPSPAKRVDALIAYLESRGLASEADVAGVVERLLAHAGPATGARLIARAWKDAAFASRLLTDANAALDELGIDLTHWAPVRLRVVANTPLMHNVVACTLCSCYPLALLGPSPAWYKSEAYRSRIVREPRAVLAEFGLTLPDGVAVTVWDSTAELRYLVLPERPADAGAVDEAELASRVTRDAMIGVAR